LKSKSHKNHLNRIKGRDVQNLEDLYIDQDETFYFIVDYTEGGAPYGVTWNEYYDNIRDFETGFYYISEITENQKIIGLTWDEYLKGLDKDLKDEFKNGENLR